MTSTLGVEIAHTSFVSCRRDNAVVAAYVESFEKYCKSKIFKSYCFKANWGPPQPLNLPSEDCLEFEFADDNGIKLLSWGESDFYKYFTMEDNSSTKVYPVGEVGRDDVHMVFESAMLCGSAGGYLMDYNPGTYHYIKRNCHTFTEFMLHFLKLPYWNPGAGMPGSFMPESRKKNPVKGAIASMFKVGPLRTSKKCSE